MSYLVSGLGGKVGGGVLTGQELGHIAPVVAETEMLGPVFQTPIADTTVSSREENRNPASAC